MRDAIQTATTSTSVSALDRFIATIDEIVAVENDDRHVVESVCEHLGPLLHETSWLAPEFREPWAERYRPHLVAVAPSRRFSVMSLVWLPGQVTPIHDHICWCVVGVLQGVEREQRFSLREDDNGSRWLAPLDDYLVQVGQVSSLIPPDENIHQVRNAGENLAISIHVYGADLRVHLSSINQCFDDLTVRTGPLDGHPVAWRPQRDLK